MDVENRLPATIVANRPRQTKRKRKPTKNDQAITRKPKSQDSTKSKHKSNDFKHVCRICLLAEDDNMVAMTSKIGSDCVADMFHSITSIEVDLEDEEKNFPVSICGACHSKLIDCYGFKIKCLESNSILQSKIDTKNNGSKKVSSIAGKNDKEIQTCAEDFIIADTKKDDAEKEKYFVNFDDAYKTETDGDDNDEEIEFLEDDSCIEEPIIKQEIEKQIQQITYNFLKERKNQKSHKQFSCSSCFKKFLKLKSLRAHVKVCSEAIKSEFTCSQCSECFDSEHDLKIHSAVHVKGSEWKCIECEKEFTERSRFRRHIRRHMATMKRWSCAACGKAFAERSALRRHERVHTGETAAKRFRCDLCDKRFADSNQLREHSAKHTGERPCACEACGKAFASSRLLASHRRVHSDHLPYECSYCHKRFRMKATLKTHHRTHTGERPYTCTICGKGFIQASNLSLHMRVHTGEKPYSCEVCGRKFAAGSTLAVHMRVHTGEKPYGCPICGKRFARTDIKPHMRLHTGERPYACTACPKRFVSSAALREHSVVHTGERRFQCTLCPEEYKKKIYLMNHIDKVHSKERDVLIKVAPYTTDLNDKINKLDCENKNQALDADEIPLDDTEELILPVDSDVKVIKEQQNNINYQNNNDASLNEVALDNDSNIIEGEINESDSIHEGTTVKVYQLDKSLLQIQAAGGHVTVRKITTKMISNY